MKGSERMYRGRRMYGYRVPRPSTMSVGKVSSGDMGCFTIILVMFSVLGIAALIGSILYNIYTFVTENMGISILIFFVTMTGIMLWVALKTPKEIMEEQEHIQEDDKDVVVLVEKIEKDK